MSLYKCVNRGRSRKRNGRILDISKVEPTGLANRFDGRHELQRRIKK